MHLWKTHCNYISFGSPNCWMALSALQGSSRVMWTLRFWLFTLLSACREIPELAASEMMATNWRKERGLDYYWSLYSSKVLLDTDQSSHSSNENRNSTTSTLSDLFTTHEAVFLLEVDVVYGKTLLSPWLIADAAVRTPHHTTLTTSHLQKKK